MQVFFLGYRQAIVLEAQTPPCLSFPFASLVFIQTEGLFSVAVKSVQSQSLNAKGGRLLTSCIYDFQLFRIGLIYEFGSMECKGSAKEPKSLHQRT